MIEKLEAGELKQLLKDLKKYKELKDKLGNRGIQIYKNSLENKKDFVVEYSSESLKDFVIGEAIEIYKNIFKIDVNSSDIKLVLNTELIGGMKVYFEDNMVDLSFSKYKKELSK